MSKRIITILLLTCSLAAASPREAKEKAAVPPVGLEKQVEAYASKFLPYDPQSKVTATRSTESVPGFISFKVKRTAKYERLNVERVFYVSEDGKWFFPGDTLANATPRPVRTAQDLAWLDEKIGKLFHTQVRTVLTPDRDAAGLKGVAIQVDTGYMAVRMPGYVSPDGKTYLQGTLWDFKTDPRA